jgi:hypothetical protein
MQIMLQRNYILLKEELHPIAWAEMLKMIFKLLSEVLLEEQTQQRSNS